MDKTELLNIITELSHEFGTSNYVLGGGGNTSAKNDTTLWVKPSGTTLAGLEPELFVALDRAVLGRLYEIEPPSEPSNREELIKDKMAAAVSADTPGRASVEAPLHESLSAVFVVHTHPVLVNGLTCAVNGKSECARLFPEALWLDYIDPGYTLCMKVRQEISNYKAANGCEPSMIFLKNHGLFVAADTPYEIRAIYAKVIDTLKSEYAAAGISTAIKVAEDPDASVIDADSRIINSAFDDSDQAIAACGIFSYANGPVSPDHIVYAKSFPCTGKITADSIKSYKDKYGYFPCIIAADNAVYAVGASENKASLALQLALDGALVVQLAEAFGGIDYMTDQARHFIENWEVESYRSKQV